MLGTGKPERAFACPVCLLRAAADLARLPLRHPPVFTSMPMLRPLPSLAACACRSLFSTSVASNPLLSASCGLQEGAGQDQGSQ